MTDAVEVCTWCGCEVESSNGYRAYEPAGERRATFCRLEHLVPWMIQGPHWEPGAIGETEEVIASGGETACAGCGGPLGDSRTVLVRRRAEHRVVDWFCSADHMAGWARSGGRWQ